MACALAGATAVSPGCGDGGGGGSDSGTDGGRSGDQGAGGEILACDRADLVISAIDIDAGTVTLLNPTGSDIALEGTGYQLCQGPGKYASLPTGTVEAGGTFTFSISSPITFAAAGGTLALYSTSAFTTRDAMLDYVCWGDGGGTPRLDVAQRTGTDGTDLWDDGGCVTLGSATELYLRSGVAGNTAADYDTSPTGLTCDASPDMDMGVVDDAGTDMGLDAGPTVLLECDRTTLLLESVNTQTEEITIYNPTGSAISTNGYQFCQGPGKYAAVPVMSVPANGRITVSAPGAIDAGADQTLALYTTSTFAGAAGREAMSDYMCWGTGGTRPRLTEARMTGSDGTVLWDDGGCTPASANDTIYRVPSTEGNSASHYSTTPQTQLSCP